MKTPNETVWLGWLGLAMPIGVLVSLLVTALVLGGRILPGPDAPDLRVEVTAYNWGWAFAYPNDRMSERTLHIPANAKVDLVITASDVIHGFWVPRLAGKMDAIPGHTSHDFEVVAYDEAGWQAFLETTE